MYALSLVRIAIALMLPVAVVAQVQADSPISMDFDLADGDQRQVVAIVGGAGTTVSLQLHARDVPEISGWSADIEFDANEVSYVSGSFVAGSFIPGLLALVDEQSALVGVGGTVLGTASSNSGNGYLGLVSFVVEEGFEDATDLVITRTSFRRVDGIEDKRTVRFVATIQKSAGLLPGDFDASGKVDFDDFFLFADAFGGSDPQYDIDASGKIDFDDFFLFADSFGKEAPVEPIKPPEPPEPSQPTTGEVTIVGTIEGEATGRVRVVGTIEETPTGEVKIIGTIEDDAPTGEVTVIGTIEDEGGGTVRIVGTIEEPVEVEVKIVGVIEELPTGKVNIVGRIEDVAAVKAVLAADLFSAEEENHGQEKIVREP